MEAKRKEADAAQKIVNDKKRKGRIGRGKWKTLNPVTFIFVNCVPTLKFIFVVPIIFKPDEEELINPFKLLISLPKIEYYYLYP